MTATRSEQSALGLQENGNEFTIPYLDGNAAAGELSKVFAVDITAAEGKCGSCGATRRFAEHTCTWVGLA